MIETVVGSFFRLLKKPSLIAPGAFLVLAQAILFYVFFYLNDTLPRFYYEIFVQNIFPDAGLFETIFLLVMGNTEEFVFLFFMIVLWFASSIWMIFSFTRVVEKDAAPIESTFFPLKHIGKVIGLAVFFGIVLLLFFAVTIFFTWLIVLGGIMETIGLIGILLWILFGAFIYFKLLFLPIEFFSGEKHITEAIKTTWTWSGKRFFSIIFFVTLSLAVSNIFVSVGLTLSDFIPIEIVSILIILISMALSYSYFGFAMVNYYHSQK